MKDPDLYAHRSDLDGDAMDTAEWRIRRRIGNTLYAIESNKSLSHMDPGDVRRLAFAAQQIKEGAPRIFGLIDELKRNEHPSFRLLMRGLDDLTEGLVEAATRLAATPSGQNFFDNLKDHEKGRSLRAARDLKNSDRLQAIDEAIIASVLAQRVSGKWPSEWKLADAIRIDVRKRLKGSGFRIGPTAVYERLRQLIVSERLSRSALIEAS